MRFSKKKSFYTSLKVLLVKFKTGFSNDILSFMQWTRQALIENYLPLHDRMRCFIRTLAIEKYTRRTARLLLILDDEKDAVIYIKKSAAFRDYLSRYTKEDVWLR